MKLSEWRKLSPLPLHETDMFISHICGLDKAHIITEGASFELSERMLSSLDSFKYRRLSGEPIQYILGYAYFMGRKFTVSPGVLIPRGDTEILVSEAFNTLRDSINPGAKCRILDMCSGSGCIGISLMLELSECYMHDNISDIAELTMADISESALHISEENAKLLVPDIDIHTVQSSFWENIPEQKFDCIISNPPYIPTSDIECLDIDVKSHEPYIALDGGLDGLDAYREIEKGISEHIADSGHLFFEIGINEAEAVKDIFTRHFNKCDVIKDLSGIERVLHLYNA